MLLRYVIPGVPSIDLLSKAEFLSIQNSFPLSS